MTPFYDATLTEGGPGACGIGKFMAGGCCDAYGLAQGFTYTVLQVALLLLRVGWRALRIVLSQCLPADAVAVIMHTVWQPPAILLVHNGWIYPVLA